LNKLFRNLSLALLVIAFASMQAFAQAGYQRQGQTGPVSGGVNAGWCAESSYLAGPDVCLWRVGANQVGFNNGNGPVASLLPVSPNAFLNPPAAAGSLGTSTTGGTIAAGTYRVALTHASLTGGRTTISTDSSSTQATTGSTSTLTGNAPAAVAGGAGYEIWVSPAGGAANSEVLQPITTAVCSGAFVNAGGNTICPYGSNYTLTSLSSTGLAVPGTNTAGLVNMTFGPQTAVTSVTTAQTMLSIPVAAGAQNVQGKDVRCRFYGVYTSPGTTAPVMTFQATEGGQTPIAITAAAISTTASTNMPWEFDFDLITTTTGASGVVEPHGHLDLNITANTPAAASATYHDTNTAGATAFSLAAANTLAIQVSATLSVSSVTLRGGSCEFIQN
jgi:hypothetical protein